MNETLAMLKAHPFLAGMKEEHLEALAGCCAERVTLPGGKPIFREGEKADACYLIIDGDVAVEVSIPGRGTHVFQTLHAGDVLGWSWLFPPYRWSFDAQALTDTEAIRLDAESLRSLKDTDLEFGYVLMNKFAEVMLARLQAARLQLLDVYGNPR